MRQLLALALLALLIHVPRAWAEHEFQKSISRHLFEVMGLTIPDHKRATHQWTFKQLTSKRFPLDTASQSTILRAILKVSYLTFKRLGPKKTKPFYRFVKKASKKLSQGALKTFLSSPWRLKGRPGIPIEVVNEVLSGLSEVEEISIEELVSITKEMVELYGDIYFVEPVQGNSSGLTEERVEEIKTALKKCIRVRSDQCFERMYESFTTIDPFLQAQISSVIQTIPEIFPETVRLAQKVRAKIRNVSLKEEIALYQEVDEFRDGKDGATLDLCKPGVLRYVTQQGSRHRFKEAFSRLEVAAVEDILSPHCSAEWGPLERLALLNYGELYSKLPEAVQSHLSENISCEGWKLSPWTLLPIPVLERCMSGTTLNDFIGLPFTLVPEHLKEGLYQFLCQHGVAWAAIDHRHIFGSTLWASKNIMESIGRGNGTMDMRVRFLSFMQALTILKSFDVGECDRSLIQATASALGLATNTLLNPTQLVEVLRTLFEDLNEHQLQHLSLGIRLLRLPWVLVDQKDFYSELIDQIDLFPELLPEPSLLRDWCEQASNGYRRLETFEYEQYFNASFDKSEETRQLVTLILSLNHLSFLTFYNSGQIRRYAIKERSLQYGATLDLSDIQEQNPRKLAQMFLLKTGRFIVENPALFQAENLNIKYGHGFDAGAITRMWLERIEEAIHFPENHLMIKDRHGYAIPHILVGEMGARQLGSIYGILLAFSVTPSVQLSPRFIDLLPKANYPEVVNKFFEAHYGSLSKNMKRKMKRLLQTQLSLSEIGAKSNFFGKSTPKGTDPVAYCKANFQKLVHSFAEGFYAFVRASAHKSLLKAQDREVLYRLLGPLHVSFEELWKNTHIHNGSVGEILIESLIPGHKLSISNAIKSVWSSLDASELDRLYELFTGTKRLLGGTHQLSVNLEIAQPDAYLDSGAKSCCILKPIRGMDKMILVKDLREPSGLTKRKVVKRILEDAETRPAEQFISPQRYIELFRLVAKKQWELLGFTNEDYDFDPFNPDAPNFWDGRNLPGRFQSCGMKLTLSVLDHTTSSRLKRSGAMFVSQMINLLNTNIRGFFD